MGEKQFASTFIPPALMCPCLAVLDFWGEMNFAEKETLGDAVWGGEMMGLVSHRGTI